MHCTIEITGFFKFVQFLVQCNGIGGHISFFKTFCRLYLILAEFQINRSGFLVETTLFQCLSSIRIILQQLHIHKSRFPVIFLPDQFLCYIHVFCAQLTECVIRHYGYPTTRILRIVKQRKIKPPLLHIERGISGTSCGAVRIKRYCVVERFFRVIFQQVHQTVEMLLVPAFQVFIVCLQCICPVRFFSCKQVFH